MPIIHYAGQGSTSLPKLAGLRHLVHFRTAEGTVNGILHAAEQNTVLALRSMGSGLAHMNPNDQVILRRLANGYFYELDDIITSLSNLNDTLSGTGPGRKYFPNSPKKRQLGIDPSADMAEQLTTLANFATIAPEIANSGALLMAKVAEKAINTFRPGAIFMARIPFEQEKKVVQLIQKVYAANEEGALKPDMELVLPVLGLIASLKTDPTIDLDIGAENYLPTNLWISVDEVEMSVSTYNCLRNANIKYLGQLVQETEGDLLKIKNFSRKNLKDVKEFLAIMGLELNMKAEGWTKDGPPPPKPGIKLGGLVG